MSTLVAQTISNGTVSTSSANVIQGSAKAWVNFNGTNGSIRSSYNVGSVTRNTTGDYTINFSNAMSDANYGYALSGKHTTSVIIPTTVEHNSVSPTTTALRIQCWNSVNSQGDPTSVCVTIFR